LRWFVEFSQRSLITDQCPLLPLNTRLCHDI
jgi:hypothetical protein